MRHFSEHLSMLLSIVQDTFSIPLIRCHFWSLSIYSDLVILEKEILEIIRRFLKKNFNWAIKRLDYLRKQIIFSLIKISFNCNCTRDITQSHRFQFSMILEPKLPNVIRAKVAFIYSIVLSKRRFEDVGDTHHG